MRAPNSITDCFCPQRRPTERFAYSHLRDAPSNDWKLGDCVRSFDQSFLELLIPLLSTQKDMMINLFGDRNAFYFLLRALF